MGLEIESDWEQLARARAYVEEETYSARENFRWKEKKEKKALYYRSKPNGITEQKFLEIWFILPPLLFTLKSSL